MVGRHPFPGPGLAIRILGEVTREQVKIAQHADAIFIEEIRKAGLYDQISQAFCALLPVRAVGVQGDRRTYEQVICLRAVKTEDFMTADWFDFPPAVLRKMSNRITNEVQGVVRFGVSVAQGYFGADGCSSPIALFPTPSRHRRLSLVRVVVSLAEPSCHGRYFQGEQFYGSSLARTKRSRLSSVAQPPGTVEWL